MNLFIDPNLFIGVIFSSDARILSEFSQRVILVSRRQSVLQTIGYCHVDTPLATAVIVYCGIDVETYVAFIERISLESEYLAICRQVIALLIARFVFDFKEKRDLTWRVYFGAIA